MQSGKAKWFDLTRGFGFIPTEEGDVRLHKKNAVHMERNAKGKIRFTQRPYHRAPSVDDVLYYTLGRRTDGKLYAEVWGFADEVQETEKAA